MTNTAMKAMRGGKAEERKPRHPEDFYPTPPEAVRALLQQERARLYGHTIWEPACGDGAMVAEIRAAGFRCLASDVVDRSCPDSVCPVDYFKVQRSPGHAIVTNPPYMLANGARGASWIRHAIGMPGWSYMALLMNAEWDRSQKVRALLEEAPYSYRWDLGWRIDWDGRGRPSTWHSWFVWDPGSAERMHVRFMPRPEEIPS